MARLPKKGDQASESRRAVICHDRMMSLFDREANFERERSYKFTSGEGFLYIIEGNKSLNVQGFKLYVQSHGYITGLRPGIGYVSS